MPSTIGHAFAGFAVATTLAPAAAPRHLLIIATLCAVLLDVDAIGRPFGLGDIAWLGGHRGFTHSLFFAAALSALVIAIGFRGSSWDGLQLRLWLAIAAATASHGVLDSMTTYGQGVMFFAPFSAQRYESPWQPFHGIVPEMVGLWLPGLLLVMWRSRVDHKEEQ